jgi:hypothetical protein
VYDIKEICKLCLKEVEDEIHFLLKCEALQNMRTPFIDLINNNNYNQCIIHSCISNTDI